MFQGVYISIICLQWLSGISRTINIIIIFAGNILKREVEMLARSLMQTELRVGFLDIYSSTLFNTDVTKYSSSSYIVTSHDKETQKYLAKV